MTIDTDLWAEATRLALDDLPSTGTVPADDNDLQQLGADYANLFPTLGGAIAVPIPPGIAAGVAAAVVQPLIDSYNDIRLEMHHWQGYLDRTKGDPAAVRMHAESLRDAASAMSVSQQALTSISDVLADQWQGPSASAFLRVRGVHAACWEPVAPALSRSAQVWLDMAMASGRARYLFVEGLRGLMVGVLELLAEGIFTALTTAMLHPHRVVAAIAIATEYAHRILAFVGDALEQIVEKTAEVCEPASAEAGELTRYAAAWQRAGEMLRSGRHPSVPEPGDGSFADEMLGTNVHDEDFVMAALAEASYSDDPPSPVPGTDFVPMSDDQLIAAGIDPALLDDPESGFHAEVFTNKDGEIVIAYRGTEFGQDYNVDVAEDAFGSVAVSAQTANALALAEAVNGAYGADNVVHTGHSLGGRLAAVAAIASGSPAVTFNAAGLSEATYAQIAAQTGSTPEEIQAWAENGGIRSYWTDDDILTQAQEEGVFGIDTTSLHDAPGHRINVGPGAHEDIFDAMEEYQDNLRPSGAEEP